MLSVAGNICRSPTAEAVFKAVVKRSNVQDEFFIDSCGTGGGNEDWYFHYDTCATTAPLCTAYATDRNEMYAADICYIQV